MRMYHFRVVASFVLAIFLTSISVVLIAWACDDLKNAVQDRERDVKDAKRKVTQLEAKGLTGSIATGTATGIVVGGTSGFAVGWKAGVASTPLTGPIGVKAGIIGGVALGSVSGGLAGGASGAINYFNNLQAAKDDLEYYESELAKAKSKYERCKNPPTTFTYTDYWGRVHTFPDKESYNNFLRSRGHSTI